jgi:2-iminobutanoate/2-iminopropanoate deaminase
MSIEHIATAEAPAAIGPYSQAVRAGGFLFISGQLGMVPHTGLMAGEGIAEQARQALTNLGAILSAAGLDWGAVVKTTVYLADMQDFALINEIYAEFFGGAMPARAAVQVAALPKKARMEIDAIAFCG